MKLLLSLVLCLALHSLSAQHLPDLKNIQPHDTFSNILVRKLYSDSLSSSFLIWVKKEVPLHKHMLHSEHVYIIEGKGMMTLGDSSFLIKTGDMVFIPKGTPHDFRTTSKRPAKILSVQSPHFDGSDRVPLKRKED